LAGITIENHHDASEQFLHFEATEQKHGREINADWGWITPPMSGSATPVFHREFNNEVKGPNFFYRETAFGVSRSNGNSGKCPFHIQSVKRTSL
jgi:nitric-oxide synthase